MYAHLSHVLCSVIGQSKASSNQLEIETHRPAHIFYGKTDLSIVLKEQCVYHCPIFYEMGREIIISLSEALVHSARNTKTNNA